MIPDARLGEAEAATASAVVEAIFQRDYWKEQVDLRMLALDQLQKARGITQPPRPEV